MSVIRGLLVSLLLCLLGAAAAFAQPVGPENSPILSPSRDKPMLLAVAPNVVSGPRDRRSSV
jgi:hypothetical protein